MLDVGKTHHLVETGCFAASRQGQLGGNEGKIHSEIFQGFKCFKENAHYNLYLSKQGK